MKKKHADDVAQRKVTKALYESERRYRLLVEGVVDYAIYFLDPHGTITNWNAGARRIKGYEAHEIVGKHFSIFYTAEDCAAGLPQRSLETARREGRFEAEGTRVRKNGTLFRATVVIDALYEDGELVGFAKITRDVSETRAAQQALVQSEERFQLLVSAVTDYALYLLDAEGNVTSWNSGGVQIKGYQHNEIIGQHFSKFYTDVDRVNEKPARALQIARDTGRYEEEGWRVRKNGSHFWASVVIDAVKDEDGKIIGFAKITRDITERKKAQDEIDKMQQQLAEAQKMDALGQLTGGVAHDFNNLLMVISGHLQMLKAAVPDAPRAARALKAIEAATKRGATLTQQLLTFSRRQRVNPETLQLADRISDVRRMLMSGLPKGVRLIIDVPDDIWPVRVDAGELEIAVLNLVLNSRDAMPQGGQITIFAENEIITDDPELGSGEFVVLSVRDEGQGIPEDIANRVFDPFFTTKPVGKGTGLGLSQVHGFAHQAGGTVRIKSVLGKGTTVSIYFPHQEEPLITQSDTASKSATVLLVEDHPDVASASIVLLEQLGYTVKWATDAERALREIEADGIDVVFSDIVMPGELDGLGLARVIKRKYPGLPIILATGYSDAARNASGDFPILRKPFHIEELSSVLAACLKA